ncbi:MAG: hypothetical protein ACLTSO_11480 [Coprococcus sp.]
MTFASGSTVRVCGNDSCGSRQRGRCGGCGCRTRDYMYRSGDSKAAQDAEFTVTAVAEDYTMGRRMLCQLRTG